MDKRKNQRSTSEYSTSLVGKIPPQDLKMEAAVIGSLINHPKVFTDEMKELMQDEGFFYKDIHALIFNSFLEIWNKNKTPDLLLLIENLTAKGSIETVGGAYGLTQFQEFLTDSTFQTYVLSLYEKHLARKAILAAGKMIAEAFDPASDIFDVISDCEKSILELSIKNNGNDVQRAQISAQMVLDDITHKIANKVQISGVLSDFKNLDAITGGWQKTDLIILAARPSVGKTAFSLNLALNAAKNGHHTAVFNLEMGDEQLATRMLSIVSQIDMYQLKNPLGNDSMRIAPMDEKQIGDLQKANQIIAQLPLYIEDQSALTVSQLKSKCRRLKKKHGLSLVVVDYLQLMNGGKEYKGNREQEIAHISRELKVLAKELKIPIIALSQLSRGVETRSDKKPTLSDLRESGAIEQDADIVAFLYRSTEEQIKEQPLLMNATLLDIQKHRNGRLDAMPFYSNLAIQKFYENNPKDQVFSQPQPQNFEVYENSHKSFTGIEPAPF